MKTSSCKAKGRKLQQLIRNSLRELGKSRGLVDGDIESRGMGQNGVDVILSPAAQKVFDFEIEAKCVEKLQVVPTFWEHYDKYKDKKGLKLLIHSKNRSLPLVTMTWEQFLGLITPQHE